MKNEIKLYVSFQIFKIFILSPGLNHLYIGSKVREMNFNHDIWMSFYEKFIFSNVASEEILINSCHDIFESNMHFSKSFIIICPKTLSFVHKKYIVNIICLIFFFWLLLQLKFETQWGLFGILHRFTFYEVAIFVEDSSIF